MTAREQEDLLRQWQDLWRSGAFRSVISAGLPFVYGDPGTSKADVSAEAAFSRSREIVGPIP